MDLKGLPQTVQNFIEETIRNRENGKFPDNETCQKVMEYAADTGSQKLTGLGLYYLGSVIGRTASMRIPCNALQRVSVI